MACDDAATVSDLEAFQQQLDRSVSTWPMRPALHTRANAVDQWPKPITPLTQELIAFPQERGLDDGFTGVLGLAESYEPWSWNGVFYGWVTYGVDPAADLADNLPGWSRTGVYADYFGVVEDADAPPRPKSRVRPLRTAGIGWNFLRTMRRYPRDSERLRIEAERLLRADLQQDWKSESDAELAARVRGHSTVHRAQRVPHGLASVVAAALFDNVSAAVKELADDEGAALLQDAVGGSGSVHLSAATAAMARVASGGLSREDFLDQFGFRGTNEFELAAKPWADDPTTLDRLIDAVGNASQTKALERRAAARTRLETLAGKGWPLLRWRLRLLESHMSWRENGKIPMVMSTHSLRQVTHEIGCRLADRARIDDPSHVFYLLPSELEAELDGRPVDDLHQAVERRRKTHELAADLPLPEMIDAHPGVLKPISRQRWKELGVLPPASLDIVSPQLTGVGGAPGVVTGRARIVSDPNAVEIDDGDILVATGTDSAWTPLFLQAAAVVVDVGGAMSHSAIAAREIGIPCVVNVKTGTRRINEGQKITVDGNNGTVTLD